MRADCEAARDLARISVVARRDGGAVGSAGAPLDAGRGLFPDRHASGLGIALGASAQEREVHGESSAFAGHGIAMAWGILPAPAEADTQVVLRVARAGGDHIAVSVDGVDPFSGRRQTLLALAPLGESREIRSPRETFADFPRREIHFYTAADRVAGRPGLTVYFLGVPDTTPEFASEAALDAYLEATLRKLRGG